MPRSVSPYMRYGRYSPQSEARLKTHVVASGETIDGITHRYWGDRRLWRVLADRNNIHDPRKVEAGTVLFIPEMPVEEGFFDSL